MSRTDQPASPARYSASKTILGSKHMKFSFSHGVDKQCYTDGNGHTVSTCMFSWPIKSGTGTSGEAFLSLWETARLNNGIRSHVGQTGLTGGTSALNLSEALELRVFSQACNWCGPLRCVASISPVFSFSVAHPNSSVCLARPGTKSARRWPWRSSLPRWESQPCRQRSSDPAPDYWRP